MNGKKKTIRKIHLWLGFTSGLLVFVIALTGCIYAFQEEIQDLSQPYRFAETQNAPYLLPSQVQQIADKALPGKHIHAVQYYKAGRAAKAIYYNFDEHYYYFVYINPYTGKVLNVKDVNNSFFGFILEGHFYLWLPPEIGQPVVATATLVFFFILVSGIYLWWPRNKGAAKQRFSVKWKAKWRRKNYDLHSVLGFYASWLGLVLVVTGLVWGFVWFRNGVYSTVSGGKDYVDYYNPISDTTAIATNNPLDKVWVTMQAAYPNYDWIEVHPPEDSKMAIAANANPDGSTYWKTDYRYFDQYTLAELPVAHIWGRYANATTADKLMRMNYDIHVGGILGFAGKVLAFLVSLIIASLPVTGFLLWWGRTRKSPKTTVKVTAVSSPQQQQTVSV